MLGDSRVITTNQLGSHPDLLHWVERARDAQYRKPIARFNAEAFADLQHWLLNDPSPWILDSGCGTGLSSILLAQQFPQHRVVGVDRSEHRLRKAAASHARIVWVRADLIDFWRLLAASEWRPDQHFLLYPNPYPKQQHLKQRWHAHPVFPYLVRCCPHITCRTNWLIYAQELQQALQVYELDARLSPVSPNPPISAFERKYHASGHALWEVAVGAQHAS